MDSSGLASTSAGHYGNGWITARAGGLGQNRGESRAEEQGLRTLASQKSCRLGIFSPNIALANHYLFSGQRLGRKMRIFDGSLRPGLLTSGPSGLVFEGANPVRRNTGRRRLASAFGPDVRGCQSSSEKHRKAPASLSLKCVPQSARQRRVSQFQVVKWPMINGKSQMTAREWPQCDPTCASLTG